MTMFSMGTVNTENSKSRPIDWILGFAFIITGFLGWRQNILWGEKGASVKEEKKKRANCEIIIKRFFFVSVNSFLLFKKKI